MAPSRGINFAAATVILLGLLWLIYFNAHPRPDFDPQPHRALGQVMAEEAMAMLGPEGRLILFARDYESFDVPAAKAQIEAFSAAVKAAGKTIAVTNLLQLDPLRSTGVPADGLLEAARRARTGDVIVLFLRPPELTEKQMQLLASRPVKVLALCSGSIPRQIPLRTMIAQGVVHKAIVNRSWQLPQPRASGTVRQWFDSLYQVVSRDNLTELTAAP